MTWLNRLTPKFFSITESEHQDKKGSEGIGIVARNHYGFSKVDDLPQDEGLQELYNKAYDNFGIVAKIIDTTTEQTVQDFSFEGKNSKNLEELRKKLNIDRHLHRVCKTMIKNGNCFVEVVKSKKNMFKLKLLPPEQMVVVRKPTGMIIAYVQVTTTKNIIWGEIDERLSIFSGKTNSVVGKKEDIIHYAFNAQAGAKYGLSLIRPAMRMLRVKEQIEGDLPIILQRYLSPIIHAKVGNEDMRPTKDQVEEVGNKLKNIYADTEYATDYLVDLQVLGFKDKGAMDVESIINIIDKDIMMAMGMYPVLTGKTDVGDTKSAEVQLRAEGRHIKAIQRELKTEFEDKFIIGQGLGTDDDHLVWELVDERERVEHIANVIQIFQAGLLTKQKANELLPKEFHEVLPKEELVDIGSDSDSGTTPHQKPIVQNPTDSHQSTQMVSGQRVPRDDHRNPLDKKVRDTGKSQHEVKR